MHNASCMAGMAFTNASLGITHSLAHALGGVFRLPHGRANALLMAEVVAWNADYYGRCETDAARKYARLAHLLDLPAATTRQGVASLLVAIQALKDEMSMPAGIRDTGVLVMTRLNSGWRRWSARRYATAVPRRTHARRTLMH